MYTNIGLLNATESQVNAAHTGTVTQYTVEYIRELNMQVMGSKWLRTHACTRTHSILRVKQENQQHRKDNTTAHFFLIPSYF